MSEKKIIFSTENLTVGYPDKIVATELNFQLTESKLIGLIGANGIGKSTLLKTISGILKPISGKIFIENQNLNNISPKQLSRKISLVLTDKLTLSNLTVFEVVALGRHPYTNWLGTLSEKDLAQTNLALQITQIEHLAQKKYFEISDGQLQKVLIARTLAQDTPLIILDEPTTHLDFQHKILTLKLLQNLAKNQQKTILFSTHDLELAIQMCDEIMLMTPEFFEINLPKNLIDNNHLNYLFKDESIFFDKEKEKFVFKNF
ncbi:ATP-binding cassette domain-containing protein [Flavobacterium sp. NST-5]|uniref:ATP-binding cassette domain-containing protein n=1 Tax=Flavobacterium ichthyis TaxID=2698827 RepID=A0ABW9ZBE7_9FLAO|nr:ABC transporter ATP-binding protein [Flavobacterium ichthyis]NBL66031.1 ATP-binding cassette domain-containing protein [Flavobacterium ichthyis]